jgi:hypothetical protein
MMRFLMLGLACLGLTLQAADEAPNRYLRLLFIQAPEDCPNSLFLVAGKEVKEIDLPRLSISSKRFGLPAGPVRVFVAEKAPTKAEPLAADAPFVDIPDNMMEVLVLLLPNGQKGHLAFRMLPVEFSRGRAPDGAVVWFNLSTRTVHAKLGTAQGVIEPRQSLIMTPSGRLGEVYPVVVDLSPANGETDNVPLMRSNWVKEANQRHLLFVVPDETRVVPRVMAVPDHMEPVAPLPMPGEKKATNKASEKKETSKNSPAK